VKGSVGFMLPSPTISTSIRIAYGVSEAARLLDVSRAHLYRLIHDGTIPARKSGKRTLILHTDLEAHARSLPAFQPSTAAPAEE
jgi:excisionase family DNA binding protein